MKNLIQWQLNPVSDDSGMAGDIPVNFYPEQAPQSQGDAPVVMQGTPGTTVLCTLPDSPIRLTHNLNERLFVVAGDNLYEVLDTCAYVLKGSVSKLVGNLASSDNGVTLCIVGGGAGYAYTDAVGIEDLSGRSGWLPATYITYQDGRFVFVKKDSGTFFISELYSSTFDPLEFASAESSPDDTLAIWSLGQQLWIYGAETIERWYNSGNADFPFERINSAISQVGIAAPFSVAEIDSSLLWVGDERIIFQSSGYTPMRISTHYIESQIDQGTITDAKAWFYTEKGHSFYVVTFPSLLDGAGLTFSYDLATKMWHRRSHFEWGRHHIFTGVRIWGRNIVGDFNSGDIYQLDQDAYQDDSLDILGVIETADLFTVSEWIRHAYLELDARKGYGGTVMLEISDDGGKTWRNKPDASLGATGHYQHRTHWTRLGRSKRRRYKVSISSNVKRVFRGLYGGLPNARG
jgi:hypothetical protein